MSEKLPAAVNTEHSQSDKGSEQSHHEDVAARENPIDPSLEKKLIRKIDLRLMPVLCVLLLCAFVDRINIGNARIQGLEESLEMTGNDYSTALYTFFITYVLFEIPCNMLLKKIRPSLFLSVIIGCCGVVTIGQGVTQSFEGLVVCRVLIGLFEAGFVPGCVYLISMYFKRHELQWRINLFYAASIAAGAFSGFLAYAIAHMDGVGGYEGWRWIFILEGKSERPLQIRAVHDPNNFAGAATVFISAGSYFILPDWPHNSKFLSDQERELLLARLALDTPDSSMDHWNKQTARRVFGDFKIWLGALMYLGIVTSTYATSFFIPTILRQLGWTSLRAQVMSIPIYMAAMVITLTMAILTDKLRHRFSFIIVGCLSCSVGYAVLLSMLDVSVGARYFALYLVTCGCWLAQPITVVWLNNNLGGHYKRGVGAAIQLSIGNCSGVIASNIFLTSQAPTYHLGYGMGLACVWLCGFSAVTFLVFIRRENGIRERGGRDDRYRLPEPEKRNLGDDHPRFRFTY